MVLQRDKVFFRASRMLCLATALLLLSGCGASQGDLKGTVTYQGKPVCSGSVQAIGSDGSALSLAIAEDGTYFIPKLPAGTVKLAVTSPDPNVTPRPNKLNKNPKPPPKNTSWFPIPEKYADPEKSGITTTIDNTVNEFDIKLD